MKGISVLLQIIKIAKISIRYKIRNEHTHRSKRVRSLLALISRHWRSVRYADWQPDELDQDKEDSDSEQRQRRDQMIAKLSLMIVNENQLQFEGILHFHEWIRRFRIEATETERKKTGNWFKDLKQIVRRKGSNNVGVGRKFISKKLAFLLNFPENCQFWLVKSEFESWIEIHLPSFFSLEWNGSR